MDLTSMGFIGNPQCLQKMTSLEAPWAWTKRDTDSSKLKHILESPTLQGKKELPWLSANMYQFLWKRKNDSEDGALRAQVRTSIGKSVKESLPSRSTGC